MVEIPSLVESDLEILKGKRVIIYGHQINDMMQLCSVLKYFNIKIIGYYTEKRVSRFKTALIGIKKINIARIKKLKLQNNDIILQSVFPCDEVCHLAQTMGVECSGLKGVEVSSSFAYLTVLPLLKKPVTYLLLSVFWKIHAHIRNLIPVKNLKKLKDKNLIILCFPPKTADVTVMKTIEFNNEKVSCDIESLNLQHRPKKFNFQVYEKHLKNCRVIVALRDPIAQNLSLLYHHIATGNIYFDWMLGEIEGESVQARNDILNEHENLILQSRSNAQLLWDAFVDRYVYPQKPFRMEYPRVIQQFIPAFAANVVDVTAYSFDQEKGYTIIKEGNTEVFVYQLEKLNRLVPELSVWLGVPFDKLENGNQASDKWIAESYKQAQKEIEITQEYFDKCFAEPYVQHCYSQADIERFKEKWRANIKCP